MPLPRLLALLIGLLLLAGCDAFDDDPSQQYTLSSPPVSDSFTDPGQWDRLEIPNDSVDFQVQFGGYHALTGVRKYNWALNHLEHSNVVLEIETLQRGNLQENAYGLICRADPSNNGAGYYFLISGEGKYMIGQRDDHYLAPLINWSRSRHIKRGRALNTVRAVCIDDYLALYVNDNFVAEVRDSTYSSGYAGIAAAVFEIGIAHFSFDELKIWEAELAP